MSNFLLRVVLECFSSDLENGTHLKLNNHLYQAECQKQNLLHLPILKLIPVPLGDRLYPPVLPEYQMPRARGCSACPARGRGGSQPSPSLHELSIRRQLVLGADITDKVSTLRAGLGQVPSLGSAGEP